MPNCGISIATGILSKAVILWKHWIEEDRTQSPAGAVPLNVTIGPDYQYLVHMIMTGHRASSTVLSRRWRTPTGVDLILSTIRRRLLRSELMAWMPLGRILLS